MPTWTGTDEYDTYGGVARHEWGNRSVPYWIRKALHRCINHCVPNLWGSKGSRQLLSSILSLLCLETFVAFACRWKKDKRLWAVRRTVRLDPDLPIQSQTHIQKLLNGACTCTRASALKQVELEPKHRNSTNDQQPKLEHSHPQRTTFAFWNDARPARS